MDSREVMLKNYYDRSHVYLLDDRYDKPKHIFTVLGDRINVLVGKEMAHSLLDVGGACGELAYYIKKRFPTIEITTLESDKKLYAYGRKRVPNCRFVNGDANKMDIFSNGTFDIVTMIGVLSIFDDFTVALSECIRVARKTGTIFIFGQFNEYPIDVLKRWRYSNDKYDWNPGYNLFSKRSVSEYLKTNKRVKAHAFYKFYMPFDLRKQDDVIRTWTEPDKDGKKMLVNGLGEVNLQILTISLR